jgi:hypothetical protein
MTAHEQEIVAHGVAESFWIGQALTPGMDPEFANMFAETAEVHAAAAWATADMAEVITLPVGEATVLEAAA